MRCERTQLERAVRQLVVILRMPGAVALRQGHPGPPLGRRLGAHHARLAFPTHEERARRRRVQEGVGAIDVVRAHGQLEAAEPVLEPDPSGPCRGDAPGLLVHLRHGKRPPVLVERAQAIHVPLVLTDEIAAGRPHREPDIHGRGAAVLGLQRDLRAARLGLRDPQDVRGRHARGSLADEAALLWTARSQRWTRASRTSESGVSAFSRSRRTNRAYSRLMRRGYSL